MLRASRDGYGAGWAIATGRVVVDTRDRTTINNSVIFSNLGCADRSTAATGNGSNIEIRTPILSLTNGSQLQSLVYGEGDAGNVRIAVSTRATFDSGSILSTVGEPGINKVAAGNGGDIEIRTLPLLRERSSFASRGERSKHEDVWGQIWAFSLFSWGL